METTARSSGSVARQANPGWGPYATVTASYWAFTITDGAIRMLVVLYFYQLGYSPLDIALLFVFYEVFGVITNLVGGWLGSRFGLNRIMHAGMALQVVALLALAAPAAWLSIGYVMAVQALSGIAKDLNKMSAKASVKRLLPEANDARLLRWVAVLTGSKNALKGAGYFIGAVLLSSVGFQGALWVLAGLLLLVLAATFVLLPASLGTTQHKAKFSRLLARSAAINRLSAARFFLFGARDVWFVVALPVYLTSAGWAHSSVGAFLALWIIGYGAVQALAPRWLSLRGKPPTGDQAFGWVAALFMVPALMLLAIIGGAGTLQVVLFGLAVFGVVFALNSALHSYLILWYAERDQVSLDVGFYYMANAGGRLVGTLLSGWVYQAQGLAACLWCSAVLLLLATLVSRHLPATADQP